MIKRDEYIDKLKHKLDDWNDDIDKLEAKTEQVKDGLKEKYKEEIGVVRQQRDNIKVKTRELVDSSEEAWGELRAGVETAWHQLTEAIDRAHSKF